MFPNETRQVQQMRGVPVRAEETKSRMLLVKAKLP